MSTKFRSQMKEVMQMAWSFVRKNGYSMSEALKCAWANLKLKAALKVEIGSTSRKAFGTLLENRVPETKGTKKTADNCQVYFDTEKEEWRCFKKCNLIKIA